MLFAWQLSQRERQEIWFFDSLTKGPAGPFVLDCRKTPSGFSDKLLQSAARTHCTPKAYNSHTCSLRCIFAHVHAAVKNVLGFVFHLREKFCEAFLTS